RETNKKYLYLGFWIEESAKMAYKARFRPLQMLVAGTWRQMP
ncbi:MAG: arginyltransferase, partial [Rhodospirillaceae bacterium]|nr:arginyltransferase [Rhodospirillaceae bacterium]